MINKIPVIGAAVVADCYWVHRLIMSVDYPTEEFVIINNNGTGKLDEELLSLSKMKHKFIDKIKVCNLPANIGCAGAWNLIIKSYMMKPFWIISNDDVAFGQGLLKEMIDALNADEELGMIHPNTGDFNIGSWDLFLITEKIISQFGLFDENIYPAYCEDADYIMRFIYQPIKKMIGCKNSYLHGTGDKSEYYTHGRQTEKSDTNLKLLLDKANSLNIEYLTKKWGAGWRSVAPYEFPYDNKSMPISYTTYDLNFVRQKYTGF